MPDAVHYQCDGAHGDAGGDEAAAEDCQAGAESVAQNPAHADTVDILPRSCTQQAQY